MSAKLSCSTLCNELLRVLLSTLIAWLVCVREARGEGTGDKTQQA